MYRSQGNQPPRQAKPVFHVEQRWGAFGHRVLTGTTKVLPASSRESLTARSVIVWEGLPEVIRARRRLRPEDD